MKNLQKILNDNQHIIGLCVSFLLGLTPLLWFGGNMLAGEEFYALDYGKWGEMFVESWFNRINFGEYSVLLPFRLQFIFFKVLNLLHFSNYYDLVFWHVLLFTISAVSFYYFLLKVFGTKYSILHYLSATMYYVYGPYFLNISVLLSPARLVFAILPLIFLLFQKILTNPKMTFYYIFLLNILLLLASPIFVNIPQGLALLSVIFLFFIYTGISKQLSLKNATLQLIFFGFLFLIFQAWWIIPTGYKQLKGIDVLKNEAATFITIDKSKTADVISLFGSWAFREKIFNTPYYYFSYNKFFDSFIGVLIRYIPLLLIISGLYLLYKKPAQFGKSKTTVLFIILIYAIYIFLAKGTNEPFGFVYKILYAYFPLFWMYREPYAKFIPIASFAASVLLVLGIEDCFQYVQQTKIRNWQVIGKYLVILLILLTVGTFSKYYIFKDVIWKINDGVNRSNVVEIPEGWKQISAKWQPSSGYYFMYPPSNLFGYYKWPSGYVGNPFLMLTNANTLNPGSGYSESENVQRKIIVDYLWTLITERPEDYFKSCVRYGLGGAILQKDTVDNDLFAYQMRKIAEPLKKYQQFDNDNATIFECPNKDIQKINFLATSSLVNIRAEDFGNYHFIVPLLSFNNIFNIDSQNSSFASYQPVLEEKTNTVSYSMDIAPDSKRKFYMLGNLENIGTVMMGDKVAIKKQIGKYIQLYPDNTLECCKTISFKAVSSPFVTITQKNRWFKSSSQKITLDNLVDMENEKIYLNKDENYLTKLDNFNPHQNYRIQIGLKAASSNLPFGLSLVQIDTKTKATRFFVNTRIMDLRSLPVFDYQGITSNFSDTSESSEYYIAIYGLNLVNGYPPESFVIPGDITIIENKIPVVFSLLFDETATDLSQNLIDYSEKGNSLIMFGGKSDNSTNAIVHFKNSYDKQWRLIELSENDFKKLEHNYNQTSTKLQLYKLASLSPEPMNLEYYSNGWQISLDSHPKYFAIVFWPTLLADILTRMSLISIILVTVLIIYLVYRRRKSA